MVLRNPRFCKGPSARICLPPVVACLLAGLLLAPDCLADARAADAPLAVMFTAPKKDKESKGFIGLVTAAFSTVPGLVLLEGGESDRIQAEIDLSAGGLVAEDSLVKDRRIRPDVTVALTVGPADPSIHAIQVQGFVEGPTGRHEYSFTLPSNGDAGLRAAFGAQIARTLPQELRRLLDAGCLRDSLTLTDLEGDRCVNEILARCEVEAERREQPACAARYGAAVRKRALAARDAPIEPTADEKALGDRIRSNPRAPLGDADKRLYEGMVKRSQEQKRNFTNALDRFRERLASALFGLLAPEHRAISFHDDAVGTFALTGAAIIAARWSAHEPAPTYLVTLAFKAPDRHWSRNDFGTIRKFVDRLRSFGVKGVGTGGTIFDIRLMVADEHRTRGSLDTVIAVDLVSRSASLAPYEPQYRTDPED